MNPLAHSTQRCRGHYALLLTFKVYARRTQSLPPRSCCTPRQQRSCRLHRAGRSPARRQVRPAARGAEQRRDLPWRLYIEPWRQYGTPRQSCYQTAASSYLSPSTGQKDVRKAPPNGCPVPVQAPDPLLRCFNNLTLPLPSVPKATRHSAGTLPRARTDPPLWSCPGSADGLGLDSQAFATAGLSTGGVAIATPEPTVVNPSAGREACFRLLAAWLLS
jgi:hypothetical protein